MGTKFLCILLAFSFIAVVFAFGTGQHYDAWAHLQKIINEFEGGPSLESIVEYWTKETITEKYIETIRHWIGDPLYFADAPFRPPLAGMPKPPEYSDRQWEEYKNPDNYLYVDVEMEREIYPEKVTDANWGVFEPVQSFFGSVKGFFVRSYYTVVWGVDMITYGFRMVYVIAPWNGYIKEE